MQLFNISGDLENSFNNSFVSVVVSAKLRERSYGGLNVV